MIDPYNSLLPAPVITSIQEGSEKLTVYFTSGEPGGISIPEIEYQLDDGVWIKAESLVHQIDEGLQKLYKTDRQAGNQLVDCTDHQVRSSHCGTCIEKVYQTGIEQDELGVHAEIIPAGDIRLGTHHEFTISIWASLSDMPQKERIRYTGLLVNSEGAGSFGIYHNHKENHSGIQIRPGKRNSTQAVHTNVYITDQKLTEKAHYVLSCTPDHSEGLKFYLNGVLRRICSTIGMNDFANGGDPLADGHGVIDLAGIERVFGETVENNQGIVEEARFYDRALSPGEIQILHRYPGALSAVVGGLRNGQNYSVRIRAVNRAGASEPSNRMYGTPADVPQEQIFVEDYRDRFEGDETRMIDTAIAEGQRQGKQVVFNGRVYEHRGHLNLQRGDYDLRGVPGQTVIKKTSHWTDFTSDGVTRITGIIFDGNRQRPRANRIRRSRGMFEFIQCGFRGGWQTKDSGLAASLSIEDDPESVFLKDCVISDANSEKPSGVRGDTPTCRGLYITAASGVIRMEGGEITRVGDLVTDRNGISIWDDRGRHGGGLGWHDLDGVVIQRSGDVDNEREIHFNGVTFSECRKRFIKGNMNTKNVFIEDCLFHIKTGRRCNQPVVFQRHFSGGNNYNGHMMGCTFRYDRGEDFVTRGSTAACVVFDNNAPGDRFIAKNNRLEVLDDRGAPDNWEAMFGLGTGGNGAVHGITIEGNTADVPGGFAFFIILRPDASSTSSAARERGVQGLVVKENSIGNLGRGPMRLGSPPNMDCDAGRIYHYYNIQVEKNDYRALHGEGPFRDGDLLMAGWCSDRRDTTKNEQYMVDLVIG